MKPIINSLIDNNISKFFEQKAILDLYPDMTATYKLCDGYYSVTQNFIKEIEKQIEFVSALKITEEELLWFKENYPELSDAYFIFLKNFSLSTRNIIINLTEEGFLDIEITGKWVDIVLWEIPLTTIISEIYMNFYSIKNKYNSTNPEGFAIDDYLQKIESRISWLNSLDCKFCEGGTLYRYSQFFQEFVNYHIKYRLKEKFRGSSNVKISQKLGKKPLLLSNREWEVAHIAIDGVIDTHKKSFEKWEKIFPNINFCSLYKKDELTDFFVEKIKNSTKIIIDSVDSLGKIAEYNKQNKAKIDLSEKTIIFNYSHPCLLSLENILRIEKVIKIIFGENILFKRIYVLENYLVNNISGWDFFRGRMKLYKINSIPVYDGWNFEEDIKKNLVKESWLR